MILKAYKMGSEKKNHDSNCSLFIVASSAVMVIIVAFGLNIFEGLFGGDLNYFYLYLNDYSEFDSKISYLMFLHDYLLACEISMVRTQTLSPCQTSPSKHQQMSTIKNSPLLSVSVSRIELKRTQHKSTNL